ncbi:MAG: general stress protein [Acidobacteriota bacterium]|nr:general stress protein [Acidobacteriota bacterium]
MADTNIKTVVGLFDTFTEAQQVARDLEQQGFSRADISIVANDATGEYAAEGLADAGSGAGTGAAIGGAAGLALGLVALAIPGVGPIIAAGALATALTGAGIGAVAGGLIGALTHMGVPEDEASYYNEGVKQGGALVMVRAEGDRADRAASILERSGAENVDERGSSGTVARDTAYKGGVRVY